VSDARLGSNRTDHKNGPDEQIKDLSSMYAANELHYGRIEWLAEHIRLTNFQIDPLVARKILALIERKQPNLFFELKLVRRSDLPPAREDPQLKYCREADMAYEVGKRCRFKGADRKAAYYDVAERYGLKPETVRRLIAPHKARTLEILAEEDAEAAYLKESAAKLSPPILQRNIFEDDPEGA
jgi:hypothetical protein